MNTDDKAKELVEKVAAITVKYVLNGEANEADVLDEAKECADITCNEIIKTLNEDIRDLDVRGNVLLNLIEEWQEVKSKIPSL